MRQVTSPQSPLWQTHPFIRLLSEAWVIQKQPTPAPREDSWRSLHNLQAAQPTSQSLQETLLEGVSSKQQLLTDSTTPGGWGRRLRVLHVLAFRGL